MTTLTQQQAARAVGEHTTVMAVLDPENEGLYWVHSTGMANFYRRDIEIRGVNGLFVKPAQILVNALNTHQLSEGSIVEGFIMDLRREEIPDLVNFVEGGDNGDSKFLRVIHLVGDHPPDCHCCQVTQKFRNENL